MARHEGEVKAVLVGHRCETQLAVGKIEALVGMELGPSRRCVCDPQMGPIRLLAFDDRADAPIINPHRFAWLCVLEHLG